MHCKYYNCTMRSALCLEYQARAKGKSTNKKSWTARDAIVQAWQIKYKPCLDCQQGKKIAKHGGKDEDVMELMQNQNAKTKNCPGCGPKPLSDFGRNKANKDGLQHYCRSCQSDMQRKCMDKKIEEAVRQSHGDCQVVSAKSDQAERTCTRCGWTGPERKFHKAGINGYIDICRACIRKKRKENEAAREKNTVTLGEHDIVLSFELDPDLLKSLNESARQNFRTLNNEILYRLVEMCSK